MTRASLDTVAEEWSAAFDAAEKAVETLPPADVSGFRARLKEERALVAAELTVLARTCGIGGWPSRPVRP